MINESGSVYIINGLRTSIKFLLRIDLIVAYAIICVNLYRLKLLKTPLGEHVAQMRRSQITVGLKLPRYRGYIVICCDKQFKETVDRYRTMRQLFRHNWNYQDFW